MAVRLEAALYPNFTASLALSKAGLVVKLKSLNTVTTAGAGDAAFGVALKSTESKFTPGTYLTGQKVAVVFQGIAELNLPAGNKAIAVGNILFTAAGGCVNKGSFAATNAVAGPKELQKVVGVALEAKASSVAASLRTVKALLTLNQAFHI